MKQSRPRRGHVEYPLKIHAHETQPQKRGSRNGTAHYASSSVFCFLWAQIYAWRNNMRKFSSLVYPCHKADPLTAG